MTPNLHNLWLRQANWSRRKFGPIRKRGPIGPLKHLRKEATEAIKAYNRESKAAFSHEIADCFILTLESARRGGMSLAGLLEAVEAKQQINRGRVYRPTGEDEPIFHVKG